MEEGRNNLSTMTVRHSFCQGFSEWRDHKMLAYPLIIAMCREKMERCWGVVEAYMVQSPAEIIFSSLLRNNCSNPYLAVQV